jgi:hypothetical protein
MSDLNEMDYQPDFEIADKYINFSSELLRLSLLAITGIGALMMYSFDKESNLHLTMLDKYLFFLTLFFFALASGTALGHRFWASDSLSYHIAYLRKKTQEEKQKEKVGRRLCLKRSANFLIYTEFLFGFAIIIFVVTIFQLLMKS